MRRENKNPRKILFSVLIAIAFVVLAGIKLGYANIISPKQGINEYHFYNDTIENKDSAKEIQKQIILDGKSISDPGHVFKDKSKVLEKWQDEEGNDIKFDTPIEIKGNDKKIINVYPVFKNQVVITYYISGSTNDRVYMTDTITDASSYKLPVDPTIYDANKYFVNWSETKDGKSGVYDEESLKKDIAAGKTDIKLYAITEFKHKATFITGDGASFQDQILADDGGKLDKMPEKPTRAGYEFSHWSLTEDGDPFDLNTLVLDKDINVYAVWKPVVVDYKFKVMVQNINDDGYTFHEIISARGLNGEKTSLPFKGSENPDPKVAPSGPIVEDIAKLTEKDGRFNDSYNSKDENGKMDHTYSNPQTLDYLGFHLNEEKTKQAFETIKADGSTVVPVYMDRNVHTVWVYKNQHGVDVYPNNANWINATDENGDIHVDLRYGQSSEKWFDKLNKDYIYYRDKSIGSFYTKAPVMGDKDVYMYRVYAKGQGFQLRFVEWDPSKFNAQINSGSLDQLKATLGTMKEIGGRVKFENTEHYYNYNGFRYRVYEPRNGMWDNTTYSWVDKTDHVDDIKGFQPKTGDMSRDGLQSVNVNNPAFRDYMFAAGKGVGGYENYTGTPYIDNGSYVGFLFYERKTYNIIYYSGNKKLASNPYKYEADTSDFGLNYKIGETTNPDNPNQVFMGWYEDSTFSVEHKHEDGAKMPAHDITVYAKWDSRQYEVTFHTNQDDYKKDIEKITEIPEDDTLYDGKYKDAKVSEENFPQPVKPKDATEFLGWYEKNKNGRFVKANLHKPIKNNDTHLYAKWKYDYLELKYDLNLPATDKVEGKAPTDSNSYIKDAKAQATDVGNVKVNGGKKVFVGWSETKDGSSGLILPSETVLMDKNKTLYAQWKEIPDLPTTKVTYDANGGVGDQYVVEEIITNDSHKVLGNGEGEKINYTREGYVFKGWNRDKNATKAEFQKDDEVTVTSLDESTNNYIYAIWAPIINYTTDGNGQVKEGENFVDNTNEEVELKSNPKGTETKANEGFKFSHWTADKEITLNNGTKIPAGEKITDEQLKQAVITEPLTFKANFVKDAPKEFNVTHEFKVAEDSPVKEMPADVKKAVDAQLPEDKKAEDGKTTTPGELKDPKDVEDKTNDGVWTFEGFEDQDPDTKDVDAKVNGADVKFEGEWKFTPNKHEVTYEYVSGTKGLELPEALKAKAPEKVTGKVKGEKVTSPVPEGKDAEFRDETNKGTWTFKSYDKDSVEITNKDENVQGTWEFTPDQEPGKYNVTHEFKVAEDSPVKEMPADVKKAVDAQLPEDKKAEDGKTTTPGELKAPKDVEDKTNDGVWKFEGFKDQNPDTEAVDAKVNGADVKFEGEWKFKPNEHKVTYEYVSGTKGVELPETLKNKAPEKVTGKVKGDKVTSPVPTGDDATFRDETNKGTWTFKSYDRNEVEITNKDENVTGTWEFTPDQQPEKYNVTHEFVSKDPNKELPQEVLALLPADQTGKEKGDVVKPTEPKTKTVEVKDGTWKFVSYDKDSKTVEDKDVEFTGTWEFTPKTTPIDYNVSHKFVSATEGKTLPKAVTDLTPDQQTGKKDGETVTPTAPTQTEVKDTENDGTWKFEGYDENSKTINKSDVTFEGKWKFTLNEHKVTYEYVSGTEGVELPEALKAKAPDEVTGKVKGDTVTSPVPTGDDATFRDDVNKGTWTFKSYDKNDVTISNKDEKVTGTWEFTPDVVTEYVDEDGNTISQKENGEKEKKDIDGYEFVRTEKDDKGNTKHIYKKKTTPTDYNVNHKFVSATEGKDLPKAVTDLTPDQQTGKKDGDTVTPTAPTQKEVKDTENDGTWTFEGYDENSKTINKSDVTFEGKWKFTPNEHKVTYKFESEDPTKPLPKEVTDLLPDPEKGKVKGDKVTPTKPVPESITTKDGVWTFVGYDEESKTVGDKDVEFIGKWKFSPKPDPVTYNVNHQFKSATKGKDLPQAVKDQLPDQQTGIEDGKTVTPTSPKKEKVEDTDNDGTWTFKGYKDLDTTTDDVDAKVDGADVMFEGSWEFTPNKHKVTYEYVSGTKGVNLPAELKAKAPKEVTGKVKGDKVTSPVPEGKDAEFRDDKNKGTWTFKSFDKNSVEISNQDEKVTGTWVFTPDPEYKVEHKFVSSTKGKDLPKAVTDLTPAQQTGKKDGETVTPTAPKETKVEDKTNDGTWTFEGYDKDSKTIDKSDVTFEGKWKFTPNKHEVIHKFVSKDPNKKLPKEVTDLLPANQTEKVKGDEVTPSEPQTKTVKVKDGTWKFVSYDKDNKTVEDKDVEFIGTWEFTPKTTPTDVVTEYVDEDGNTIAPKENGTKAKKDIDGYEFVRTETDEQGNTKHIYKKKVTPPADVVTEYVDEDGKTISPKENGTKEKKDIDGYVFVRTETDDKGNTKHIYKKKTTPSPSVVTKFVDEKGNPIAKDEDGKQDKKDIPGYEFVKTETDKDGNVIHVYKFKQTPSPTVETRYVDTEGNQILADKAGTHDPSTIEGYQFVKTEKDEKGNTVHIYKKLAPVPKVETRYVDENGNQLLPPKEGTQNQVNIDGYDYVSTNKDNNGNTIHVYKKKPIQDVETRYLDTEGNQILADKAGTHDPSTIEGYQLVRTEKDENGNTRHIYQKLAPAVKVETRYVDENGNQLLLPKEGTQNQVNIDGYDYVSTNKDNNGNTIHVYKKKVLTPDVVTKYVDENGNEIADTQKGKHPSKNIEGYEIITTKSDEKGNIIYVYRKKPDSTKVVTEYVDENGKTIAPKEDGKQPNKDIDGYEFVRTEKDEKGNTKHIYKKKTTPPTEVVTEYVDEDGKTIAPKETGTKDKKDIEGYEFVKTEKDNKGNTKHIYKKKSPSAENKYKVTHKFESTTPGKTLPKEILDLLPKNQEGIENGRKVYPTKPSKLEVKVKDGTWVFEGYDKDSSTIDNKDVNFTGKWKFVPNKIGKVRVSTGANSRSKSNVKTGIEGSSNLIFVLIGSAFALYKNKKNRY